MQCYYVDVECMEVHKICKPQFSLSTPTYYLVLTYIRNDNFQMDKIIACYLKKLGKHH